MKINFYNGWTGNSMKAGGCFPIQVFDLYFDIHPSYKIIDLTILNFTIQLEFLE